MAQHPDPNHLSPHPIQTEVPPAALPITPAAQPESGLPIDLFRPWWKNPVVLLLGGVVFLLATLIILVAVVLVALMPRRGPSPEVAVKPQVSLPMSSTRPAAAAWPRPSWASITAAP